eukprot:437680-Hanusia_phi.AAC.1
MGGVSSGGPLRTVSGRGPKGSSDGLESSTRFVQGVGVLVFVCPRPAELVSLSLGGRGGHDEILRVEAGGRDNGDRGKLIKGVGVGAFGMKGGGEGLKRDHLGWCRHLPLGGGMYGWMEGKQHGRGVGSATAEVGLKGKRGDEVMRGGGGRLKK